jgi:hypothetical protein
MATSNTYEFGTNTQIDDLIRESFERIGIIGNEFTGLQIQSAIMSANLELTAWTGKVPLSWMRKRMMVTIYPNQPIYQLPINITRVVDVVATQPTRINVGGTAFSSAGGTAANCFNPLSNTGCTQTAAEGYISYDYGAGVNYSIQYVGITPLASQANYTLAIEYSFDNVNWSTAYQAPTQTYFANQITWFVIENSLNARAWRIRETDGATLAIQQIYFSQPTTVGVGDRTLQGLSYTEWMQITSKMNPGFLSAYFFNAQIQPTITVWPVPNLSSLSNQVTTLLFTAYSYSQDVNALFEGFDIPQRFYDALVAGISARLAMKFAPDRFQLCKAEANETFALATKTDYEDVTLRFQPDFSCYS